MTTETVSISKAQQRQYQDEGYVILEHVMPDEHLQVLREECQRFIDEMHAEMDRQGTDTLGISHRNKRYFIAHAAARSPRIRSFVFSDLLADICRATIGDEAYLYWDQYVVKAAEVGMKFSWHQDSAFNATAPHRPYVSIWCALDDMTEANGTTYILPYSRAGTRERIEHTKEEGTNDLIGYRGDDPGEIVLVPAGSIALFSSFTLHRSGVNTTDQMRRVYLVQFSPEVIQRADGTGPAGGTEQFLHHGRRVL
jgi:ectoine hydroxylase-related dioxygenase (phytanoyl-CoA dioxygenase family)